MRRTCRLALGIAIRAMLAIGCHDATSSSPTRTADGSADSPLAGVITPALGGGEGATGGIAAGSVDFDGDGQDDVGVFRNGMWFMTYSGDYSGLDQVSAFGSPMAGRDTPDLGEFNCLAAGGGAPDGKTDLVILRKAYSTRQVTLSPDWTGTADLSLTIGTTAHKAISARRLDTNGDGCSDIGVFRNGCFDIVESPGYGAIARHVCFGIGTDQPLAADLNGDGRSELILWRGLSSHYSVKLSPDYETDLSVDMGGGDLPLIGDFNGDGRGDLGSYVQLTSTFRFTHSPDFEGVDLVRTHGVDGDIPIVADVNGDQLDDLGVFRGATALWRFKCSPAWTASCLSRSFGSAGDSPIYGRPPGAWVRPGTETTWHIQLTGTVGTDSPAELYEIDLFDSAESLIMDLGLQGRKVICYFSAGSGEQWRPDYDRFDPEDLGNPLDGWPGERWLDIRSTNVREIMRSRLDLAAGKGCDGVDPDNVDGHQNNTGFDLTASDQIDFNRFLAREAHGRGLAAALKNDGDQAADLVSSFDMEVNEQCHEFDECQVLSVFLQTAKPVFNIEYRDTLAEAEALAQTLCPLARSEGLRTLIMPPLLDGTFRVPCD